MITLNIPPVCNPIRTDAAPFAFYEKLQLLYAMCAMRGEYAASGSISIAWAKKMVKDLHGREYGEHIWDAAVAEFEKQNEGLKVKR